MITANKRKWWWCNCNSNKNSQSNLGKAASQPLAQRMDSSAACATICAMPYCRRVQSLSRGYATSTPQCHNHSSNTLSLHCAVRFPHQKITPSRWDPDPPLKRSSTGPPDPLPQMTTLTSDVNKDSRLKAKARTKDWDFVLQDKQGARPRTTSLQMTYWHRLHTLNLYCYWACLYRINYTNLQE